MIRKMAKLFFSFSCEKRCEMRVPAKLPATVSKVNEPIIAQSTGTAPM